MLHKIEETPVFKIAEKQCKIDNASRSSRLANNYRRHVTIPLLKHIELTIESPEYTEAYAFAVELAQQRQQDSKKNDSLLTRFAKAKMAILGARQVK